MQSLRRAHMSFDFRGWSSCEDCSAMWVENRAEHFALTRRLMKRNGVRAKRDAWLPQNPLKTPMGAARGEGFWGGKGAADRPLSAD